MSKTDYSKAYNKAYYDDYSCGTGYKNKNIWHMFFNGVANEIITRFNPRTVLDMGCAFGYLVQALREKGVEAYGIDVFRICCKPGR